MGKKDECGRFCLDVASEDQFRVGLFWGFFGQNGTCEKRFERDNQTDAPPASHFFVHFCAKKQNKQQSTP
jgi:hypothetical protein